MPQPKLHACAAARQAAYRQRCEQARQAALAAKGLPSLPVLATIPGGARWKASLRSAQELIADTLGEMQDYFDERSESWQESSRGEEHQERIASVEAVLEALEELIP
jgi:protein involved in temperature-dependent protein secretion